MPLKEAPADWENAVSKAMQHDESVGHNLETWNSCPGCGAKWKDPVRTEGIMHRSQSCGSCLRRQAS